MDQNWYKKTPLAAMTGLRFVLARSIQSRVAAYPKGTKVRVISKFNGVTLRADPCPHCGISVFITKVSPRDIELDRDDPEKPALALYDGG